MSEVKRLKCQPLDSLESLKCSSKVSIKKAIDGRSAGSVSDGADADGFRTDSMTFPEKLMNLLECGIVNDTMWWLPDGDAFCFIPNLFAEMVLDKHFQGTKFESFTRKLNRWYVYLQILLGLFSMFI